MLELEPTKCEHGEGLVHVIATMRSDVIMHVVLYDQDCALLLLAPPCCNGTGIVRVGAAAGTSVW